MYLRVSTDSQDVAAQKHAIDKWLETHDHESVTYFTDKMSGKHDNRPELKKLKLAVAYGGFDTVVVYRLDRLSRKAATTLQLLLDWVSNDIGFIAVDQPILHLGHDNPFRLTFAAMLSEVSQLERETIVTRVKSGLEAAKARGVKLGAKPKLTNQQVIEAQRLRDAGWTLRDIAKEFDVNYSTICRRTK